MGQVSTHAEPDTSGAQAEHCSPQTPEGVAWDISLTVDERRARLEDRYLTVSHQYHADPSPRHLEAVREVREALHVLSAMSRSPEDWDHFMSPAVFEDGLQRH